MNQIISESPDNSPGNPTRNVQPQDSSDLESRMAKLVGLEEESPSFEDDSATPRQSSLVESQEPQDVQTQQPLSSNPFAKLGVVGAATLSVVVVAGVFLTQLMSSSNRPSTQSRRVVPEAPTQPRPESRLEQLEKENETLRAKLALTEQAEAVKQAQQQLRRVKPTPIPRVAAQPSTRAEPQPTRPTVVVQPRPAAPEVRIVYRDRFIDRPVPIRVSPNRTDRVSPPTIRRTQQTRSLPVPPSLPVIPPPVTTPTTEPTVELTPTPTPDPLQEWTRLAKLGSYGQVSTPDNQSANNTTIAQRPNTPIQRVQPPQVPIRIAQPSTEVSPPVSSVARSKSSNKSTVVGSTAKATLVNGLYGSTTNTPNNRSSSASRASSGSSDSSNNNNQVVIMQLGESLKDGNGSDIIPKGAKLQARPNFNDAGLVTLSVDTATWEEKGTSVRKSIPQGALSVSGNNGRPPVAKQYIEGGGGSSFGRDAKLFALGGVQKVGEVINRPRRSCNERYVDEEREDGGTRRVYAGQICEDDNNDNIVASIVDGGARSIVPEITRRTQQSQSQRIQRTQRTNVWWLPAGEKMQVRVERAFE